MTDLKPPLFIYADLSTGHLPYQEMQTLTDAPPRVLTHEYGAWVNVPADFEDDDHEDYWEDFPALRKVIEWARKQGANWINFDADGDTVDDLPTWEW